MSASELSFEKLEPALLAYDVRTVIEAFKGRSEKERRALAPALIRAHRQYGPYAQRGVVLALLASASLSELRRLEGSMGWHIEFGDEEYEVLADRRPSWLEPWLRRQLERTPLLPAAGDRRGRSAGA